MFYAQLTITVIAGWNLKKKKSLFVFCISINKNKPLKPADEKVCPFSGQLAVLLQVPFNLV